MRLDAIDEVRRHRGFQRPAHDDAHRRALLGEEHRGLAGRVPAADDDDRRPGAPARLELGGRVVHAGHLVALEAVDRELAVVRAGRRDERAAGDLRAVGQRGHDVPGDVVERGHRAGAGDHGPELLGLDRCPGGEVLAGDAGREAEVVLDARARRRLPADRDGVDRQRPQPLGRAVDRRGQPGRSGTDDDQVVAALGQRVGGHAQVEREVAGGGALEEARSVITMRQVGGGHAEAVEDGGDIVVRRRRRSSGGAAGCAPRTRAAPWTPA